MTRVIQKWGLGRLWLCTFHRALRAWREGLFSPWLGPRGQRQMAQAALQLRMPVLPSPSDAPFTIEFITGERHAYQTAFCLHSLGCAAPGRWRFLIHSDGSLQPQVAAALTAISPAVEIVDPAETRERIEHHLPSSRFPTLRRWRESLFFVAKLTEVQAGRHGWSLLLDSDMLFLQPPTELIQWCEAPTTPVFLHDPHTLLGAAPDEIAAACGTMPMLHLNAGLVGVNRDRLDWEQIEHWAARIVPIARDPWHAEQGLWAVLAASQGGRLLPRDRYIVQPTRRQVRHRVGALHHYTAPSRGFYHRWAWRTLASS